ncbi:unnamed protein product [Mytilus edulis]|uniref:Uncharacterized protein n=1 Tax=Mytilus edulis TaxID=6550 RepID=A0A8S3TKM0_MYTED|nr:unnamed protein product [Mytilus edulis]
MTGSLDQIHSKYGIQGGYVQHQIHEKPGEHNMIVGKVMQTSLNGGGAGNSHLPGRCINSHPEKCPMSCQEVDSVTGCIVCISSCHNRQHATQIYRTTDNRQSASPYTDNTEQTIDNTLHRYTELQTIGSQHHPTQIIPNRQSTTRYTDIPNYRQSTTRYTDIPNYRQSTTRYTDIPNYRQSTVNETLHSKYRKEQKQLCNNTFKTAGSVTSAPTTSQPSVSTIGVQKTTTLKASHITGNKFNVIITTETTAKLKDNKAKS